jgi:hypothetical protein
LAVRSIAANTASISSYDVALASALEWHGKHALAWIEPFWLGRREVAEEGVDRREPDVAGRGRVVALRSAPVGH